MFICSLGQLWPSCLFYRISALLKACSTSDLQYWVQLNYEGFVEVHTFTYTSAAFPLFPAGTRSLHAAMVWIQQPMRC